MGSRYADKNMENPGNKKNRKRKKKRTFVDIMTTLLMLIALCVFLFSAYTLYGFYKEYKKSADEYDNLESSYAIDFGDENEEPDHTQKDTAGISGETPVTEKTVLKDIEPLEDDKALKELDQQIEEEAVETEAAVENGEEVKLPVLRNPIDFASLSEVNEDIVGWLKISALDISYPVVQGEDNDYYLHRTFEGVENFAGCIFLNCDNADDFTDQNTIVYGHNMKDGSMFGKLKKFQEEEIFKKSKYFWMFTPDKIYQYRIFSAAIVNKTGLTYQIMFEDNEFDKWITSAYENSVVENNDVEFTRDDRVMTLSTCTGNDATRFVVLGKLAQVYATAKQ